MSPPLHRRQEFGPPGPWPVAVTIPARNEAERMLACLDAARHALRGRGGIVVAVNGSQDRTLADAREWFERTGAPGLLLDLPVTPAGGVGEVRHLAVRACAGRLAPGAAVMTTDADSTVFPDWVDANLDELRGADLVCGTVIADPGEFARLPPLPEDELAALAEMEEPEMPFSSFERELVRRSLGSLEFSKRLLREAHVAVAPGVGFGESGEGYVRFALIENVHRTRQAVRGIRKFLRDAEEPA